MKASFIGFASGDDKNFYDMFVQSMEQIDIFDCMQISSKPTNRQKAHLERSDLVVIGGGDMALGWQTLEVLFFCILSFPDEYKRFR